MSSTPPSKKFKIFSEAENNISNNLNCNSVVNFSNSMDANGEFENIDVDLYSRQIYVYGCEGMRRMSYSHILIIGLDGLGVEIAKNIVLAGVKSVTLCDANDCNNFDMTTSYCVKKDDFNKNRAFVCRAQLAELNDHVTVDVLEKTTLGVEDMKKYSLVVLAQPLEEECVRYGNFCRSVGVKFVIASTQGLFGRVFCDFGANFTVIDTTGDEAPFAMVWKIDKDGVVHCLDKHGFEDDDLVMFSKVKGMTELNTCGYRKIKVIDLLKFSIGDVSTFSPYLSDGICTLVKVPLKVQFEPYSASYLSPNIMISDYVKLERSAQLHILFKALSDYREKFDKLPKPWNKVDADKFVDCVKSVNDSLNNTKAAVKTIDTNLALLFAFICAGQCSPMQSVIGSFAAQEVMKACTGKFIPLNQWLYYDAIECLPLEETSFDGKPVVSELDAEFEDSRYDLQIAIFGKDFQKKLNDLNYFIVGAGALGCELIKNFALMGVGSGPRGKIVITDMDHIERSNLNRQFLFRQWDVGKLKSSVVADSAKRINPNLHIVAHEHRVGTETEKIFDDLFFESLDGVANALDNITARNYVDRRCVYSQKPLLESGTLGTKGNVQVILPLLTESYSSSQDPPEKSFPVCTLKSFPYLIEHTLQWARDLFEGLFVQQSQSLASFKSDKLGFIDRMCTTQRLQSIENLKSLKESLIDNRPFNMQDCVTWARLLWQDLFADSISQLLYCFPPDHVTSESKFWSKDKRCPHPLQFDSNDPMHRDFIMAAANLRAYIYGINECRDYSKLVGYIEKVNVPDFKPKAGVHIDSSDAEMQTRQSSTNNDKNALDELRQALINITDFSDFHISPIEFEKDHDSNFHMDFITAASNLRATNYDITPADRFKSKLIAGKIIPAVATTTSLICGMVCLELLKIVQGHKKLCFYKNCYVDLSKPFFSLYEPVEALKMKYYDNEFTLWDYFKLSEPMTLQELIDYFKNKHNLNIIMVSYDVSMLYSSLMPEHKKRLLTPLRKLVENIRKEDIPTYCKALVFDIYASDDENNPLEVPYVRYLLS